MYKRVLHKSSQILGWLTACKVASLYKISFMLGSTAIFFSGISCMGPLVGAFSSVQICSLIFLLRTFIGYLMHGSLSYAQCALYVPGWCAALSWSYANIITRVIVPLVCMGLFIAHPSGSPVWVYSLYWLIPMGIYYRNARSIFMQALSSTFIAHAVGTVIMQYSLSMSPTTWLLLLPIVPVERILFASGMTLLYYFMVYSKTVSSRVWKKIPAYLCIRSSQA